MLNKNVFLAVALTAALAPNADATTLPVLPNGQWNTFDVDDLTSQSGGLEWIDVNDGSPLSFMFHISRPGVLTVVDAGFAGDEFEIVLNGVTYASSAAKNSFPDSVGTNFDAALADSAYSFAQFNLAPGNYTVTGLLSRSAEDDAGNAINATVGGIQVVPEPATALLLLAGTGAFGAFSRRGVR